MACFYVTIAGNYEYFLWFNFETDFLKNGNVFQNKFSEKWKRFSKKLEYCFLVKSTAIENATFAYETDLSETDFRTNRIGSTKWTYYKERSFASNYFILF